MTPRKRVLLFDDDEEATLAIGHILEDHDYEVVIAHDGCGAVEKCDCEKIDVIVVDIQRPFFSGLLFCDAFKHRPQTKNIPVVIIAGFSNKEDMNKCYAVGACACVKKPIHSEELLEAVEHAIA